MSTRRNFLKTAVAGTAAAAASVTSTPAALAGGAASDTAPQPPVDRRRLGRIEAQVSILGLGLGSAFTRANGKDPEVGRGLLLEALNRGINYWDTCRGYGDSEAIIGPVVGQRRKDIFLVTKSGSRDYDGFMRDVETSLKLLQTDRIDLMHFWNINHIDDVGEIEKGALKAMRKLKEQNVVDHHGITGHSGAGMLVEGIKRLDPDAILTVFPATREDNGRYEDELLPLAIERDMGVIGMKTVRRANNSDLVGTDLIRYALSLEGVATTIVGLDTIEHLTANAKMATGFQPLTVAERDAMHKEISLAVADIPVPWEQPGYRDGATLT